MENIKIINLSLGILSFFNPFFFVIFNDIHLFIERIISNRESIQI